MTHYGIVYGDFIDEVAYEFGGGLAVEFSPQPFSVHVTLVLKRNFMLHNSHMCDVQVKKPLKYG